MADEEGPNQSPFIVAAIGGLILGAGALVWFFFFSSTEAMVAGKVTLNNEPLAGAQVIFLGEEEQNQAPLVAPTTDEGNYKLIGHKGGGVLVGKYKVVVTK